MSAPPPSPYDEFAYPSALYPQTHPDRLATLGALFGLHPTPVDRCRVLELGCGDGSNLISMAFSLPASEFVGVDLAARPVQRGRDMIEALALRNIALHPLNLLEVPADLGRFDYIIAHGLYSWVPAEVRDKLLNLCGEHLTEHGIAYVSYNAYPGNHLRDMVRRMMRYHVAHFDLPAQQIQQGRALLKFLAGAKPEPDLYHRVLGQELERALKYTEAGFFHDDLSAINHPVYFHEFIEHATRHRLQYLGEADFMDMQSGHLPDQVRKLLLELEPNNILAHEQYLDFIKGRAFRQTLLCRSEAKLDRSLQPERAFPLHVSSPARPLSANLQVDTAAVEEFEGPKGIIIATNRPVVKAALLRLGRTWPRALSFSELLQGRSAHAATPGASPALGSAESDDAQALGEFLLRAYAVDFVELHSLPSLFVTTLSQRPMASRLARFQLQTGSMVSTLRHNALKIEDSLGQHLLRLLDGTRERAALVEDLEALLRSGAATVNLEEQPVRDLEQARAVLVRDLEKNLQSLAQSALLVA